MPIVLVNNPEINHEQNIGIMLDDDMNTALNTYGAIIDFTESYDAEICLCKIPKYNLDQLNELDNIQPVNISVDIQDAGEFVISKLMENN
jgi:hypothetical protein